MANPLLSQYAYAVGGDAGEDEDAGESRLFRARIRPIPGLSATRKLPPGRIVGIPDKWLSAKPRGVPRHRNRCYFTPGPTNTGNLLKTRLERSRQGGGRMRVG
jgi:hypothetical protein